MKHEINVGQVLFKKRHKRGDNSEIEEVVVDKVGKKYFYLDGRWMGRYPVSLETLRYEDKVYSQDGFRLYLTKQEILDGAERDSLLRSIRDLFSYKSTAELSLDQVRQIADILQLNKQ